MDAKKAPQLQRELDLIATHLNLQETDMTWQKKYTKLKELIKLISIHGEAHTALFTSAFRQMKNNIAKCLLTERTRLSGVTCELLETTAKLYPSIITPFNDFFLHSLLKLCGRPNKVFVQKATLALHAILKLGAPELYLSELFQFSKSSSNSIRFAVSDCLYLLLSSTTVVVDKWEPYLSSLETELRHLSQDKTPEVRQKTRTAIQSYLAMFPHRSKPFLDSLPSMIQKALTSSTPSSPKPMERIPIFKRPRSNLSITTTSTSGKLDSNMEVHTPLSSSFLTCASEVSLEDSDEPTKKVSRPSTTTALAETLSSSSIQETPSSSNRDSHSNLNSNSSITSSILSTPSRPPTSSLSDSFSETHSSIPTSQSSVDASSETTSTTLNTSTSFPSTSESSSLSAAPSFTSSSTSSFPSSFHSQSTTSSLFSTPLRPSASSSAFRSLHSPFQPLPSSPLYSRWPSTPTSSSQSDTHMNVPTLIMETRSSQASIRAKAFEKLAQVLPTSTTTTNFKDLNPLQLSMIECHLTNGLYMLDSKLLSVVLKNLYQLLQSDMLPSKYYEDLMARCLVIRFNPFLSSHTLVVQLCNNILNHFASSPNSFTLLGSMIPRNDLKIQAKLLVISLMTNLVQNHFSSSSSSSSPSSSSSSSFTSSSLALPPSSPSLSKSDSFSTSNSSSTHSASFFQAWYPCIQDLLPHLTDPSFTVALESLLQPFQHLEPSSFTSCHSNVATSTPSTPTLTRTASSSTTM